MTGSTKFVPCEVHVAKTFTLSPEIGKLWGDLKVEPAFILVAYEELTFVNFFH